MLTSDPVWRYKEEEMKYAHVAYGLDATTPIIASKFGGLSSLHINQMRSHAQQLVDARVTNDTGRVGEMMTTEAARHLSGSVRLLPSINIKTANEELSSWVSDDLLPRISNAASAGARKLRSHILGDNKNEIMMGKAKFTALPYLSVFDSLLMNERLRKSKLKLKYIEIYIRERLTVIYKSLFNKEYRGWLLKRISDKNWQRKKMVQLGLKKSKSR